MKMGNGVLEQVRTKTQQIVVHSGNNQNSFMYGFEVYW